MSLMVSVLMTAYNREKYIEEAIESVLSQTYNNFELIIVDDCSSDNTVAIARTFANKDARIRLYQNEKNQGDYPNRNIAASYAKGDLLLYVDSDDTICIDTLAYITYHFNQNKNVKHSTIYYEKDIDKPIVINSERAIKWHFYKNNLLATGPGARVFTNVFFREIGGFSTEYGPANDTFFNLLTTSKEDILLLPYQYLKYREHEQQEKNNQYGYLINGYLYFDKITRMNVLPISSSEIKLLRNKNKRRFIVNSIKYLQSTRNIRKTIAAFSSVNFGLIDMFKAIFLC